MAGVWLRWGRGYSRQRIGADGVPIDEFPAYTADFLEETGVRVRVRVATREVEARLWRVTRFANAPLFLLEPVAEEDRWITHRLYEPSLERRVAQEILLGVGGIRALRKLGLVDTYHFNEGHAVFAGVDDRGRLAAGRRSRGGRARADRLHHARRSGRQRGPSARRARRLGACCTRRLGDEAARRDPFNMTVAGLRLSRRANAVAALHGEISRDMWRDVEDASPILAITNGVHVPTWQDARIREACGSAAGLWATHQALKAELLAAVKTRTGTALDPDVLTIGPAAARRPQAERPDLDPAHRPLLARAGSSSSPARPSDDGGGRS